MRRPGSFPVLLAALLVLGGRTGVRLPLPAPVPLVEWLLPSPRPYGRTAKRPAMAFTPARTTRSPAATLLIPEEALPGLRLVPAGQRPGTPDPPARDPRLAPDLRF